VFKISFSNSLYFKQWENAVRKYQHTTTYIEKMLNQESS